MDAIKKRVSEVLHLKSPYVEDGGVAQYPGQPTPVEQEAYFEALQKIDFDAVKADIKEVFKASKEFWPADYGHYGPLFIRMAWHAAGTYRLSDGRGGADGGCQRLEPELSWDDNTNLVHAHTLLEPVKRKYGLGLSWGDLIVLAGTLAFEDMGCPQLGFAAGRIDHTDNSQSIGLGPSVEQERFQPMGDMNGKLPAPLGQNTMELIYVNPEGPMGNPDPQGAADTIRDVFGRMGMDDRENVALIGGGHSIGKAHGAGKEGPGPKPRQCPWNPYPGAHGTGKGNDAVTSGFEGPWTSNPTKMDNEYFKNLLNYEWEKYQSPGGPWQWRIKGEGPMAPTAQGDGKQHIIMLTTDMALVTDPKYKVFVEEFANDEKAFFEAFAAVWYKLCNRDMGPVSRLVGKDLPPPQPWQHALPAPPAKLADMKKVEHEIESVINAAHKDKGVSITKFVRLALNQANTYRHTDYQGGCNGGRIRFSPGKDWKSNEGLVDLVIPLLEPVKTKFGEGLSWADLIVLAGNVGAKILGAPKDLPFCPGRTDDTSGAAWEPLAYMNAEPPASTEELEDRVALRGLTKREFVALAFPFLPTVAKLNAMLDEPYNGDHQDVWVRTLKYTPDFKRQVEYYIDAGDVIYQKDFAKAWTKMMDADRFDGPVHRASPQ